MNTPINIAVTSFLIKFADKIIKLLTDEQNFKRIKYKMDINLLHVVKYNSNIRTIISTKLIDRKSHDLLL